MKATGDFKDRMDLGNMLEENVKEFFDEFDFEVIPFGLDSILKNSHIRSIIRKNIDYKVSMPVLMLKFSPDFIIVSKAKADHNTFFLLDTKVSITPIFFRKQIERIAKHTGKDNLQRKDILEIEREAWFTYNTFYDPNNVAILMACPYNPKVLLCEWVSNIECLWCYKTKEQGLPIPWDCSDCPIRTRNDKSFGVVVNRLSAGSGTPHTNIYANSMRPLEQFLEEEFSIDIDIDYINSFKEYFKIEKINKPKGKVNWRQDNRAIKEIRKYCPWVKPFTPRDKGQNSIEEY